MRPGTRLAGRFDRVMAQAMDIVVALVPFVAAFLLSFRLRGATVVLLLLAIPWMLFHTLLADGLGEGQSWGKRFFEIRVIDAESGAPCTFMQSFIRNVVLSGLGPIDWLFIFGERRQRLGDRAAGTFVIDAL